MPRASKVCAVPGCPAVIPAGSSRCSACTAAADSARGTATQRGYTSKGHRTFRAAVLTRDPVCVMCTSRWSTVADHYPLTRKELEAAGLDPNNPSCGRGLCKHCHDSETATHQPGGWNAPHG